MSTPAHVDDLAFYNALFHCGLLELGESSVGAVEAIEIPGPGYEVLFSRWDPAAPVLWIKRADPDVAPEHPGSRASLEREVVFLRRAAETRLRPWLVLPQDIPDPDPSVLVSAYPLRKGCRRLWEDLADGDELVRSSRSLGRALGNLHALEPSRELSGTEATLATTGLDNHHPPELDLALPHPRVYRHLSPARVEWLRALQAPNQPFLEAFARARADWTRHTEPEGGGRRCLVHGGIAPRAVLRPPGSRHIRLVGWERVGFGDPCWDLAGVLVAFTGGRRQKSVGTIRRKALDAFAEAYEREGHDPDDGGPLREPGRIVRYAAILELAAIWQRAASRQALDAEDHRRIDDARKLLRAPAAATEHFGRPLLLGFEGARSKPSDPEQVRG